MRCILIAGAGTGGHTFPALSLAQELRKKEPRDRIVFVHAGRRRFDDSACEELGEVRWIPGIGMPRRFSLRFPVFLLQTLRSVCRSLKIVRECSPNIVVGFGNFGSYGPVRAAALKGVPILLHEGNTMPGKANRRLAKFADCIAVNFPDTGKCFSGSKAEVVGMPVREEFRLPRQREKAIGYFGLAADRLTLLVMGGSQGARHINEVVCGMLTELGQIGIQVMHLTGEREFERVSAIYATRDIRCCVRSFERRMKLAFDAADIVVSRAGASSIAEIAATGKPAVLVPFPFATDNHQYWNAKYLTDRNAAMMLKDEEMTIGSLFEKLKVLIEDNGKRQELSENCARLSVPNSAEKMAELVLETAENKGKR